MKDYFVFEGQNASTGTANKITGRMSFYGRVLKFTSKEEAKKYVEQYGYGTPYSSDLCVTGTKRNMRSYCLGMSVRDFDEDLDRMDYSIFDENINSWE